MFFKLDSAQVRIVEAKCVPVCAWVSTFGLGQFKGSAFLHRGVVSLVSRPS